MGKYGIGDMGKDCILPVGSFLQICTYETNGRKLLHKIIPPWRDWSKEGRGKNQAVKEISLSVC